MEAEQVDVPEPLEVLPARLERLQELVVRLARHHLRLDDEALARHLARLDERRERVGVLHLGRAVEARRLEVHDLSLIHI